MTTATASRPARAALNGWLLGAGWGACALYTFLEVHTKALEDTRLGLAVWMPVLDGFTYLGLLGASVACALVCFTVRLRSRDAWMAAMLAFLALTLYVFGEGRLASTWIFVWICAAVMAGRAAKARGRSPWLWGILIFLFQMLPYAILATMKPKRTSAVDTLSASTDEGGDGGLYRRPSAAAARSSPPSTTARSASTAPPSAPWPPSTGNYLMQEPDRTQEAAMPVALGMGDTRPEMERSLPIPYNVGAAAITKRHDIGIDLDKWTQVHACPEGSLSLKPLSWALRGASGAWLCGAVLHEGDTWWVGTWSPMIARAKSGPASGFVWSYACFDAETARATAEADLASASQAYEKGKKKWHALLWAGAGGVALALALTGIALATAA